MDNLESEQPAIGYIKMPRIFYSHMTGKPFDKCIDCGVDLYTTDVPYVIEKAIKKYEGYSAQDVVFEYALCLDCAEKMRKQMSASSLKSMDTYFSQRLDFENRGQALLQKENYAIEDWISHCVVKGTPISESTEYQLCAFCQGDELVLSHMPYAMSAQAIDEVSLLLSPQTRGELDDFIDKNFGLPPEFKESIKGKKVVLL